MRTIMAVSAVCVARGLGFLLVSWPPTNQASGPDEMTSEMPTVTRAARVAPAPSHRPLPAAPAAISDPCMTREEFEQLPPEGQNKAMQEFIAAFWSRKSASASKAVNQETRYLSLEMFERPYMRTVTESEFARLSPPDREKAMAETRESCNQTRSYVTDAVAQGQTSMAHGDYLRAEAQFISALETETGRELSANQDGLLITRLTELACQKSVLKEMAALYTKSGHATKTQITQQQLGEIDVQAAEIRRVAQQQP